MQAVFDEYFEGSYAPANNVTDAAKNSIRIKKAPSNALKGALIAVASFLSTGAVAGAAYLTTTTVGGIIDRGEPPNGGSSDSVRELSVSTDRVSSIRLASASALSESRLDIYAVGTPKGFDFIKTLNLAENCNLNSYSAHSDKSGLAFVKAELTATVNACRHDAVIYAEYTGENSACKLFESYYSGDEQYYRGHPYLYTQTFDKGEYVSNGKLTYGGVKYYVSVKSSDKNAFYPYLDLILE